MKPIPTLLFLTLFVTFCSAQDWKPYVSNANCIYGSGQNGKKHLISVRYDSVYTSGTTTLVSLIPDHTRVIHA